MEIPFPEPVVIAGRNYWPRRVVRRWLAAVARAPEPAPRDDDEALMTARAVRDMCGGVSEMWIWRKRLRVGGGRPRGIHARAAR